MGSYYTGSGGGTPSDNSVTSAKIVDGAIATDDIAAGAVTAAKIAGGVIGAPMASTYYYAPWDHGGLTAGIPGEAVMNMLPFLIGKSCTLDRIGADASIVGSAGAVVRLGIFNHDPSTGLPGSLLLDAGTIDGTSATFQAITISQAVTAGLFWVASAVQGVAGTRPTLRVFQNAANSSTVGSTTGGSATSRGAYNQGSISGALPASGAPTGTSAVTSAPVVWLRAA